MKTYDERFQDVSKRIKRRQKYKVTIATSCVTLALVILATVLFVPYNTNPPSVQAYADSPYYALIQKINAAHYVPPVENNRFDSITNELDSVLDGGMKGETVPDAIPEDAPNSSLENVPGVNGDYVEVTDNQVAGVTEADIVKRSTEYIYYLRWEELVIYSIDGEDSELVASYPIEMEYKDSANDYGYYDTAEMYLSTDCTTVTILLTGYNSETGSCTTLINLDVTDSDNITETGRVYLSGSYLSSRVVDGQILVMNKFRVRSNCDFNDESTFLPQIGQPGDMQSLAMEEIIAPDELTSTQYTVICRLDGKTLEKLDAAAFLSYSDELYVSAENIYATRTYSQKMDKGDSKTMTEITRLHYAGEEMQLMGSVNVEGSVKDQYSMDEYKGVLRVVTSTNGMVTTMDDFAASARFSRNVNLYCIDLADMDILSAVEAFAPEGEQAESVRFDGDTGYVCTAEVITLTDPVYFFDLSDPKNITYTDTGTIDGYSSSLIQLGDGFLLGIGFGGGRELKVEVYEEMGEKVVSVCEYIRNADFSSEYKSYLVDREKDMIGLGIVDWEDGRVKYILLHFDGYELNEIVTVEMEDDSISKMRGILIDGYLYVLGLDNFAVEKVF